MTVTLRATKGSALTHAELDANFTTLDGSAATVDKVYVSDGAGGGSFKTAYTQGWEDYNDLATTSTPIALTSAGTAYNLTNDGAGSFTNTTYRLPGYSAIWNVSTNAFDWSGAGLVVGDTVDIRFDVDIVNSGANGQFDFKLDMAIGSGAAYTLEMDDHGYKSAATHKEVVFFSVYMGDTDTLNYPAKPTMTSDSTGDTVIVNGWYCRVIPRNPVYS